MEMNWDIYWHAGDVLYYVVFNIARALLAFLQWDSYLYWPFLVSTVVLVVGLAAYSSRSPNAICWPAFKLGVSSLLSRDLWWHRSARADYKLYFCNALIHPAVLAPLLMTNSTVVLELDKFLSNGGALLEISSANSWAIRAAFTIAFFLAYDFGRFASHCMLHDVQMLWPFHKVHHSAEVLTPMTSFRVHPVEILLMAWIPILATGTLTWAFNRVFGESINAYTFMGLHVIIWFFNLIDNLRHSPVWLTYGKSLDHWLISPSHHQVHHSIESRHWGCNRGSNIALWDRIYGTLYVPAEKQEAFRMGLGDGSEILWHDVWHIYVQPFKESISVLSRPLSADQGRNQK